MMYGCVFPTLQYLRQLMPICSKLPQRSQTRSDLREDEYSQDSEISTVEQAPSTTKADQFKSMLARGGKSGSAVAFALRQTLGRTMPKFRDSDEAATSLQQDRRRRKGTRPPIQHSESLDSSIDGDPMSPVSTDGEEQNIRPTGKPRGHSIASDLGSGTSASEESNTEDPESRGEGRTGYKFRPVQRTPPSSRVNGQKVNGELLTERLRRLRPNTSNVKKHTTVNRRFITNAGEQSSLASPMSLESPPSSTPSRADDQAESDDSGNRMPIRGGVVKGKATLDSTQDHARLRLFDGRATGGSSSGEKRDGLKGKEKRQKHDVGKVSKRGISALSRVPQVSEYLRQGLEAVRGAIEDGVEKNYAEAPVVGKGRPAAGMVENLLYGWFGGVVTERAWPWVGLALGPGFGDQGDRKEVSAKLGEGGKPRETEELSRFT